MEEADLFIFYPIIDPETRKPFFDGEFFLGQQHFMKITDSFSVTQNGKPVILESFRCLKRKMVLLKPTDIYLNGSALWAKKQRITFC